MKADRKSMLIGCGAMSIILILAVSFCSVATADSIPDTPGATAKTDATSFYKSVLQAGSACDEAYTVATTEMSKGDPVRAYRSVEVAETVCLGAGNEVRAVAVPASVGKAVHAKLTDAKDECAYVFTSKWSAMSEIKKVLGGEGGVAEMASVQSSVENIQGGSIKCAAGLLGSLTELGVDLESLPKID